MAAVLVLAAAWQVGAAQPKDAAKQTEWTGTVGCAKCAFGAETKADKCAAALKTADAVYLLKAGENASQETKDTLTRIELGTLKGSLTVRGTLAEADGRKVITVESAGAQAPDPNPNPGGQGGGGRGGRGGGGRGR